MKVVKILPSDYEKPKILFQAYLKRQIFFKIKHCLHTEQQHNTELGFQISLKVSIKACFFMQFERGIQNIGDKTTLILRILF